jgi:hypothetical protein
VGKGKENRDMKHSEKDQLVPQEALAELAGKLGGKTEEGPHIPSSLDELSPPEGEIGDRLGGELEEAANLLLSQLSPAIRDYAFELADLTLHIPRWQLALGAILSQYESGTLQAPASDPGWGRAVAIRERTAICQNPSCKKIFIPKRFGEKACSPACGTVLRKAVIDAHKKTTREVMTGARQAGIIG